MKILFVTECFPYPLDNGGNLRTYHILRGLAREHEVWLVSHRAKEYSDAASGALNGMCRITTVEEPPPWRRTLRSFVERGLRSYPLFVLKNWSAPLLRAVESLLEQHEFDVIHFNMLDTACYALEHNWSQYKVFDSHNCLSAMASLASQNRSGRLWRSIFGREAAKLRETERAVCRRMDQTLVCSSDDAALFRELDETASYVVVPNGVDTQYFQANGKVQEKPGTLVFVGTMGYYPNEEAALYFCRDVMPLLKDCKPSPRLVLVGKDPPASVRALHNGKSVVVTGRVEDVRPYLGRAQVVVVPLQTGSGTRLKILEAFSMGKAVVSTSLGAQGIPARDGKEILLADDPDTFAIQVRRLLESSELRQKLGHAAQELVKQTYDWTNVSRQLLEVYESLDKSARRKSPSCGSVAVAENSCVRSE